MKIKMFLFAGLLFFASNQAFAVNSFEQNGFKVIESSDNHLLLKYSLPSLRLDTIETKLGNLIGLSIKPDIAGSEIFGESGNQMQLRNSVNITVPSETGFKIESVKILSEKRLPEAMAPVPRIIFQNNTPQLSYEINLDENYSSDSEVFNYTFDYLGISRTRHLASLNLTTAYQKDNEIIIPQEVLIKIAFNPEMRDYQKISSDINDNVATSINHTLNDNWHTEPKVIESKKRETTQAVMHNQWVKIRIVKEGIYQITSTDLSELGISLSPEDVKTLKIFGDGGKELDESVLAGENNILNEQEIIVETDAGGNLQKIVFYAAPASGFEFLKDNTFEHYINHYGDINYYFLSWGGEAGKRVVAKQSPKGTVEYIPTTYTNMLYFEEEMHNAFRGGSGRQWFGRNLLPATFTEVLSNLDRTGDIFYRISVAHTAPYKGTFLVKENNETILTTQLNPVSGYHDAHRLIKTVSIPANDISQDNRSNLTFSYSNTSGAASALGYFDFYEIQYPAFFNAISNSIRFFTDIEKPGLTEYSINSFSGNEIYGYDVTDNKHPKLIANDAATGGMFVFKTMVSDSQPSRYFVSSALKKPGMELKSFTNIRTNIEESEMIVISHQSLFESAEHYKQYREKQSGYKVAIVKTSDIFDEFASGIPDPTAIRDFLSYAYNHWTNKPRNVLLWGDGHYDYKGLSTNEINFVPTYQTADNYTSFYEIESYTTDDFFASIVGEDDLIDIGIGRLPVYSNQSGREMVDKISHYENNSSKDAWRTMMTIIADDSWKSEGYDRTLHTNQAENLWDDYLPEDYIYKKIYLAEYPSENVSGGKRKPRVNEEIISTTNTNGNLLLCYIGHGNPRVWAHEEVFERSLTIPQFRNWDKLFFMTAASCDFGRFDTPEIRSGAEEMILSNFGGSIGTFSSTRLVFAEPNARLNEFLYTKIFERNPATGLRYTLGEINHLTKVTKHSENDRKYTLLGDPALKLLIPDYKIEFSSINTKDIESGDTVGILALSKITVKGYITNPIDTIADNSFNGTLILNVLDSDEYMEIFEDDGTEHGTMHRYWKNGGALSRRSYIVENGEFTAEFIIPKDISFNNQPGRLLGYAYSDDDRYASGQSRNFVITGIDESDNSDIEGPEIEIYLDSYDFISGELVNCNPLLIIDLWDESGINSTGLGLGHRIEAWIDDNPNSIDLTDKFVTSIDDSKAGVVEQLLFNLKPGTHNIKVRAWDVFNNYTTVTSYFRTIDCDGIEIWDLLSYPNPTEIKADFKFKHNVAPPFDYEVTIANTLGQIVRRMSGRITTSYSGDIYWDGLDDSGNILSAGNYLYILNVKTSKGVRTSLSNYLSIYR